MERKEQIEKLKSGKTFDILVIGGGATGCGIAVDAASRGLKVALLEQGDFGGGTSSRSTKLIHGGVRYLEQAILKFDRSQFNLVRDALRERAILFSIAPHLVWVLPILTPIYRRVHIPYYLTGLKLYDRLAGRANIHPSYFMSSKRALRRFPMLKERGLRGGVVYYDGQFDDARLNISLAITASEQGAVVSNYVKVIGFKKTKGKITGVKAHDLVQGDSFSIQVKAVVNATGPYVDAIRSLDEPKCAPLLATSSGAHIVLNKLFCPKSVGLLIPRTDDGRVLFMLPWLGHSLVGTTDNPASVEEDPKATDTDVDYILKQMNRYFSLKAERKDILSQWSGLRPLVSNPRTADTARLVRDHIINFSVSGLMTIAGGKWTTYRKMALDATDQVIKAAGLKPRFKCRTESLTLAGGVNFSPRVMLRLRKQIDLKPSIVAHLVRSYGDRALLLARLIKDGFNKRLSPQHPYLEAEVIWGATHEVARTAVDVLARRTRLAFLDRKAALEALPRVVDLLGTVYGWDKARRDLEVLNSTKQL